MKNEYEVRGETTAIFLRRRDGTVLETLIDTSDMPLVDAFPQTWGATYEKKTDSFYARLKVSQGKRDGKRIQIFFKMHNIICRPKDGFVTDHINHDTLDNRRSNLRSVSNTVNGQNRKGPLRNSTSGIRGVSWHSRDRRWIARVQHHDVRMHLGSFVDIEAARTAVESAHARIMANLLKDDRHVA